MKSVKARSGYLHYEFIKTKIAINVLSCIFYVNFVSDQFIQGKLSVSSKKKSMPLVIISYSGNYPYEPVYYSKHLVLSWLIILLSLVSMSS